MVELEQSLQNAMESLTQQGLTDKVSSGLTGLNYLNLVHAQTIQDCHVNQ